MLQQHSSSTLTVSAAGGGPGDRQTTREVRESARDGRVTNRGGQIQYSRSQIQYSRVPARQFIYEAHSMFGNNSLWFQTKREEARKQQMTNRDVQPYSPIQLNTNAMVKEVLHFSFTTNPTSILYCYLPVLILNLLFDVLQWILGNISLQVPRQNLCSILQISLIVLRKKQSHSFTVWWSPFLIYLSYLYLILFNTVRTAHSSETYCIFEQVRHT